MTHAGLLAWGVAARSQAAPAREEPPHLLTRRPTRCPRTGTAPSGWRRTRTGRPPFWCTEAGSLASPSRPFLGETGKGSVQAQVPWRKMELGGCPRPGQSCLCLCTHTGTVRTQGSPTRPPGGSEAPAAGRRPQGSRLASLPTVPWNILSHHSLRLVLPCSLALTPSLPMAPPPLRPSHMVLMRLRDGFTATWALLPALGAPGLTACLLPLVPSWNWTEAGNFHWTGK